MTKRKPHIPGTSKKLQTERLMAMDINGASDMPGVPPDLIWDESDPPILFECSGYTEHAPFCNGTCPRSVAKESQVELINESFAWNRAGMSFLGIPNAYAQHIPIRGINIELFDLEMKVQMLKSLIIEFLDIDEEEVEERFRHAKLEIMRGIRDREEDNIRRSRVQQMLQVPQNPIIGPDGRPLF